MFKVGRRGEAWFELRVTSSCSAAAFALAATAAA